MEELLIRKKKITVYPKWELEADKQLLKDSLEALNTLKELIKDKEKNGEKQNPVS